MKECYERISTVFQHLQLDGKFNQLNIQNPELAISVVDPNPKV
jgi:hypothetical protein